MFQILSCKTSIDIDLIEVFQNQFDSRMFLEWLGFWLYQMHLIMIIYNLLHGNPLSFLPSLFKNASFFGWAKEYSLKCISVVIVVLYHIYYWSNFVFALATSSKHNGIDAKGDAVNVAVIKQTIAHHLASILVTFKYILWASTIDIRLHCLIH